MKNQLQIKEEQVEKVNNNSKTEDTEQASSKTISNISNNISNNINDYYKPLPCHENLLDNYDYIQYKNIKIPRLSFTNNYHFDNYKKPFNELFAKINIDYTLTKDYLYKISKMRYDNKYINNNNNIFLPYGYFNQNNYFKNIENNNYKNQDLIIDIKNDKIENKGNSIIDIKNNINFDILNIKKEKTLENRNDESINKKKKSFKKMFYLKLYDKNKNLINKKRGRRSLKEQILHVHSALDDDNILRKIQVHFLTFLVSFTNDYIDTLFPNVDKKHVLHFRQIDYKLKKIINHNSIERTKTLTIGEILQKQASPKNKTCVNNINQITYIKLCNQCPQLKQNYFNKLFKEFFIEFYYNKNERVIALNGLNINLSKKTQTFNKLIQKNAKYSDKFRYIASFFYINNKEEKKLLKTNENMINETNINIKEKPFFIID